MSGEASMLAGACVEPGRFALLERPVPQEAPEGWLLVDIAAVGLCGTDFHILEGKHPYLAYPRVIGHELSGRVVRGEHGFDAGDLVVVNPYLSCGTCRPCRRGKPNCCMAIEVLGVHRDGGMCARIAVPAGNLIDAGSLSAHEAAMVEFLAIGAHAVARSGPGEGDRVLVTGAGPIGIGAALFARLDGAEVHLMDTSEARLDRAGALFGFEHRHVAGPDILSGELADGFDAVFDATGSARAIEAGFSLLAHGSTYVLISVVKDDISFNDAEFHKREARIVGSRNALRTDFDRVIEALSTGAIDSGALLSETVALADTPVRFPELARDREGLVKAIVTL